MIGYTSHGSAASRPVMTNMLWRASISHVSLYLDAPSWLSEHELGDSVIQKLSELRDINNVLTTEALPEETPCL